MDTLPQKHTPIKLGTQNTHSPSNTTQHEGDYSRGKLEPQVMAINNIFASFIKIKDNVTAPQGPTMALGGAYKVVGPQSSSLSFRYLSSHGSRLSSVVEDL